MPPKSRCPVPRLRVDLCPQCAAFLRALQASAGQDAVCAVAALTAAHCDLYSQQLPPELRASLLANDAISFNAVLGKPS